MGAFWYTFEVPDFQGGELCGIDGNTGSLLSPLGFSAKYRNFVVVTQIYLDRSREVFNLSTKNGGKKK